MCDESLESGGCLFLGPYTPHFSETHLLMSPIPRASDQQDARPAQAVGVVADPGSLTGCSVGVDSSVRAG